jgi:hypothetical protein
MFKPLGVSNSSRRGISSLQYLGVVAACGEFLENEAAAGLMVSLGMAAFPMKESRANFHEKYQ